MSDATQKGSYIVADEHVNHKPNAVDGGEGKQENIDLLGTILVIAYIGGQ